MANLLLLTLVFPPDNVSTAHLMGDLAVDLQMRGHRIIVLTAVPHYNDDPEARLKQPLRSHWPCLLKRSDFRGIPVYHAWVPRKGRSKFHRIASWMGFHLITTAAGFLKGLDIDVILAPSPPLTIALSAWILGFRHRAPFIYNVQEIYPDVAINLGALRNKGLIRLARALESFVYRKAGALTAISPRMRERLIAKGVPSTKVRLVPNFVDLQDFQVLPKDNDFSRTHKLHDKFVISYAGNMGKPQCLETLLQAADILKDESGIHFLMMGDGTETEALRRLSVELKLSNVTFLPYQPYSLMPQAYAAVNASYVPQAPGISDDGIPSKVYRILGAARPVIASTDTESDLARLVHASGGGVVVPPKDPVGLAEAIRNGYRQRLDWERAGLNGREHVLQFYSRGAVSLQYDALINELGGSQEARAVPVASVSGR